ncbi:MAG TPA: glycosyltransferase family 9 protein [Puia sp.]|nr:glycosyltransferase family 9 protein [Puia sp.]
MNIPAKKWKKKSPPRKVLAIRLQAMGDLVITLPYLQQLRTSLPERTRLDLLTRDEVDDIPKNIFLFDKVYSIGGGRNVKKQILHTCFLLPELLFRQYDVVLDLQNNIVSRLVRKVLSPPAWSEFDRFSPMAAGESTRLTIEATGIGKSFANPGFKFKNDLDEVELLKLNGWDERNELVILNPAGAFMSRNWPIDNYVEFANLWVSHFPKTQFLILGTGRVEIQSEHLKNKLGEKLINLVNKTSVIQAFAIIQHVKFVLSEDSGLMHMSWVSGIPILALFGSTRSVRARPLGNHSLFLDSSDLECGSCMQEICKYGDVHCLTRYTPALIFEKALSLINAYKES